MRKLILIPCCLFSFFYFVSGQRIVFRGLAKDMQGRSIPGVSVIDKKSKRGSSADTAGGFSIEVIPGTFLTVSAVGYADTSLIAHTGKEIAVVFLREIPKTLNKVTISGIPQDNTNSNSAEVLKQHFLESTLDNFAKGIGATDIPSPPSASKHNASTRPLPAVRNNGSMLPVFHQPVETKGSRYLLIDWAPGLVINRSDKLVSNPAYRFNYDKADGELLLLQGNKNCIIIDKETVKSFLLNNDANLLFETVPAIPRENYLIVLSKGDKYAVYKSLRSRLVRANAQATGMTTIGKEYNEFVDVSDFYFVDFATNEVKQFDLRKKTIQKLIPGELTKTEKYFADHKSDNVDENFVRDFIRLMNQ